MDTPIPVTRSDTQSSPSRSPDRSCETNETETVEGQAQRNIFLPNHPFFSAKARGLRTRIMRFTPSWFSVTMGTGIVNSLLFDLPWASTHSTFRGIGAAFLTFDIILFASFALISVLRYALYPAIFAVMIKNETHSLFLGTIPMGFVTIVSGIARTGGEYNIAGSLEAGLIMWWIALILSILSAFGIPYVMFTTHNHTVEALTATWLLPVVPPITIAAVGSTMSTLLINEGKLDYALTVMIASYVMNGVGLLLASGIMVLYFNRLALHHLPPREVIVSAFLPLGPCGQGGFALIELGRVAQRLFPLLAVAHPERQGDQNLALIGPAMLGAGVMSGLLLWGLGIWWMYVAVFCVGSNYIGKTVAFNMGWWAFTFPLGSLTLLTFSLGSIFSSQFFNVVGAMMTFCVVALWTIVFVPTIVGFFQGTLFAAPCLASLPLEFVERFPTAREGAREKTVSVARQVSSSGDAGVPIEGS